MKKYIKTALATLALLAVGTSCSETVDTSLLRREESEKAFASYSGDANYSKQTLGGFSGKDAFVYMQWLERGAETAPSPRATDYVRINYRGYLLSSWAKDSNSGLFQSNFDKTMPDAMQVSNMIPGFALALQKMKVGDRVSVLIPWYLAYGAVAQLSIPAYSALRFEIKLTEVLGDSPE